MLIQKGDQQKRTTITDCKVSFLYAFAHEVNALVPSAYQSDYTDGYLKSR